ncbi:polycomb group protein Psc-like [Anoplophora glabripennis]|uniref:polycomb group protein Psc-like n=1 Tax=Anoplophora glabripennis TaxID=217634 RepID=UPI000875A4E6|nr:polycomb group protein Psc-like [Anoplophora glabripennis]XP_018570893.1 polycomb group protein Psc-like [Anoplophora glabripennis]
MTQKQRMDKEEQQRVLVRDLNPVITCRLCEGYFVDATTLVDCLHVFCRACILRHFENSKTGCPTCNTMYKKKSQTCFRPDPQIQTLVYKLVPALYAKEMQRREDFYRSTGVRASSSCSDDSVIDRERDMINDQEEMISSYVGDKTQFFGPEDSISLSLEYYQAHLDSTDAEEKSKPPLLSSDSDTSSNNSSQSDGVQTQNKIKTEKPDLTNVNSDSDCTKDKEQNDGGNSVSDRDVRECDKRFLQCPPAVSMKHLQKFIRMKFGLTGDHRVDMIYKGEVLPANFSLMDVAYTFKWKRMKPMRFFYRIFTPMKVRPIKIVNTTLSTGGRQLQIVPVKPSPDPTTKPAEEVKPEAKPELDVEKSRDKDLEESEDQKNDKERLFAHLQLQSKSQVEKDKKVPEKPLIKDCVFEYEEPDQEEIKRFAEKRDREWALQKKLDDETRKDEDYVSHHFSKKRKKSKHSKNEFNLHKKRKLHAEIASNEEELKLKVKITNNGHKHKHHKSSGQVNEKTQTSDVSSKEKLLQMRQVRHKHVSSEDKNIQTVPSIKLSKDSSTSTEKIRIESGDKSKVEEKQIDIKESTEEPRKSPKIKEDIAKLKIKVTEPSSSVSESAVLPKQQSEGVSTSPKIGTFLEPTSSKPGFALKNSIEKDWVKKVPTVQLERNEQTEKQAQKTFLKTFQTYAEKYQRNEKLQQNKIENTKAKLNSVNLNKDKLIQIKTENNKITANNKSLERKIANLQQHCTIEAKPPEKIEKKMNFVNEKPKMVTPHYPAGFTVSKVEQGVKRKAEDEAMQDNRPSLEITLINPPTSSPAQQSSKPPEKPPVKRPPPATIPLDRIKKSVNLKSGISIIPKLPERCDNIGALDLSKTSMSPDNSSKISPKLDVPNGFNLVSRQLNALSRPTTTTGSEKNNIALSNLQMLSKVATEHSNLNNKTPQNTMALNKPRPQMPSLQTLKVPSLQNPGQMKAPNLQKIPKLNEIQKFRPTNPQIRNLRPNQNQNIRNIPNPSLLIRQQNQNRLSQIATMQQSSGEATKTTQSVSTNSTPSPAQKEATTATPVKSAIESKLQEKKEISV